MLVPEELSHNDVSELPHELDKTPIGLVLEPVASGVGASTFKLPRGCMAEEEYLERTVIESLATVAIKRDEGQERGEGKNCFDALLCFLPLLSGRKVGLKFILSYCRLETFFSTLSIRT